MQIICSELLFTIFSHYAEYKLATSTINKVLQVLTDSETLTTNANGVTDLKKIRPSNAILLALWVGNGSYGYMRTDSVSYDYYGFQVLNMVGGNASPTKVASTTLNVSYSYIAI